LVASSGHIHCFTDQLFFIGYSGRRKVRDQIKYSKQKQNNNTDSEENLGLSEKQKKKYYCESKRKEQMILKKDNNTINQCCENHL
jgi:hypothetical protein